MREAHNGKKILITTSISNAPCSHYFILTTWILLNWSFFFFYPWHVGVSSEFSLTRCRAKNYDHSILIDKVRKLLSSRLMINYPSEEFLARWVLTIIYLSCLTNCEVFYLIVGTLTKQYIDKRKTEEKKYPRDAGRIINNPKSSRIKTSTMDINSYIVGLSRLEESKQRVFSLRWTHERD